LRVLIYELPGDLESLDYLTPTLWDAGCQGLEEATLKDGADVLRAYFAELVELPFHGRWLEVDDTDWLERYRKSLKPIRVGRVIITPGMDIFPGDPNDIQVDLEPGLAFGTGHHETTRMAIQALQNIPLEGKAVLDVGAGSGILGIVAALMGARVLGVDNDASTVPVAIENARLNGARATFVHGVLEDVLNGSLERDVAMTRGLFSVAVSNLFAELHDALMGQYRRVLEPGGTLIMTGILAGTGVADDGERVTWDHSSGRENLVRTALEREGFDLIRREQQGEWVLLEAHAPDRTNA
jgi:ribosomal protein L11 methyltransferase